MEAVLSSQAVNTDVLPPSLSYGLDASGSFVTGRREAIVYALGSSYAPNGVKMLQFNIGSTTEWLVPESLIFSAEIENLDTTNALWAAAPDASVLFERVDIRMSGQLIESITEYARCNELFTRLTTSPMKKINSAQYGFGTQIAAAEPDWSAAQQHDAATIPKKPDAGYKKRIFWKCNLSGLLNQHRWLPLYALAQTGLSISFYLAPGADSMIKNHSGTTYSQTYQLTDAKCMCSMMSIDDELMSSFQGQLINGSALRIPFKRIESMWSYIPSSASAGKFDVSLARSYTRLCSLFASFVQEPPADGSTKLKLCNNFYTDTGSAETLTYNWQLGSKRVYDNDSVGFSEAWWRLMNCVGIAGSLSHASGISYADYATNSFCIAADLEKIAHLASTGENLSNVSQTVLRISGFGDQASELPSRCHLVAQFDCICEIRDTQVELWD
jgi:hypothetical protein